jgi:hypothetical protein
MKEKDDTLWPRPKEWQQLQHPYLPHNQDIWRLCQLHR